MSFEQTLYHLVDLVKWDDEEQDLKIYKDEKKSSTYQNFKTALSSQASRMFTTFFTMISSTANKSSVGVFADRSILARKSELDWVFSVSPVVDLVVVVQDVMLEIRRLDDPDIVLDRCVIPHDNKPSQRQICWSTDGTLLAVSLSNGRILLCYIADLKKIFVEVGEDSAVKMSSDIVISSIKLSSSLNHEQGQHMLWALTSSGDVYVYGPSQQNDFALLHTVCVKKSYSHPSSLIVNDANRCVIVGGSCPSTWCVSDRMSHKCGLTKWQMLDDFPYLMSIDHTKSDAVYKMDLSPGFLHIVVWYVSGNIAVYSFPTLERTLLWKVEDQMNLFQETLDSFHVVSHVQWWDDDSLIVLRASGDLVIVSASNSLVKDYNECENVTPYSRVASTCDGSALILECLSNHGDFADNKCLDGALKETNQWRFLSPLLDMMPWHAHDNDHISNSNGCRKYYLRSLSSMTPQELFECKIMEKEYGDALALAKGYNLDVDAVYKHQWTQSNMSMTSVEDYLSKVNDLKWVCAQCCSCVPDTLDGMMNLLVFALQLTSFERVVTGKAVDGFCWSELDLLQLLISQHDALVENEEYLEWKKGLEFWKPSAKQQELMECRHNIIQYVDCLFIYIQFLGGYNNALDDYDAEDYITFRKRDVLLSALNLAKCGNWEHLGIMFDYKWKCLAEHRLPLLSSFPETCSPESYKSLLPTLQGSKVVEYVEEDYRQVDWMEECLSAESDAESFYEENMLLQFRSKDPDEDLVAEWYKHRAEQISQITGLTDHAECLLEIGLEVGCHGLDGLQQTLTFVNYLVYDCECSGLSLKEFQAKTCLEIVRMMMSNSTSQSFVADIQQHVLPYLASQKDYSVLVEYLVETAKLDLQPCFLVFQSHARQQTFMTSIFPHSLAMVEVATRCIYAAEKEINVTQKQASHILKVLPLAEDLDAAVKTQVSALKHILDSCELLAKYKIIKTPAGLKKTLTCYKNAVTLFRSVAATMVLKPATVSLATCREVLADLLKVCGSNFDANICASIWMETLLMSEDPTCIALAGNLCQQYKEEIKISDQDLLMLVISACQAYIDSFTLQSKSIERLELARACLRVLKEQDSFVQEQIDVIKGVFSLKSLGCTDISLHGILWKSHQDILTEVLNKCWISYDNVDDILHIAYLFRVCGNDEVARMIMVYKWSLTNALLNSNYTLAQKLLEELMMNKCSDIWQQCLEVGTLGIMLDTEFRCHCLSYALSYCDEDHLLSVTKLLHKLKIQLLEESYPCDKNNDVPVDFSMPVHLKSLFYESLAEEEMCWMDLYTPSQSQTFHSYLNYLMLKRSSTAILKVLPPAKDMFLKDVAMHIAYLLAVKDIDMLKDIEGQGMRFEWAQLKILLHSMQVFVKISMETDATSGRHCLPVYRMPSWLLCDLCVKFTAAVDAETFKYIRPCLESMQIEQISKQGINVEQYFSSQQCRKDIILSLAGMANDEMFYRAVALAEHGACDVWVVLATRLDHLFKADADILERLCLLQLMPQLLKRRQRLCEWLESNTFEVVGSTNYKALMIFFTLIKKHDLNGFVQSTLNLWMDPKLHISLLETLSAEPSSLQYKSLLNCNDENHMNSILYEHLTPSLFGVCLQVLPQFNYSFNVSKSFVTSCWVKTQFWKEATSDWIERLEHCSQLLKDLSFADMCAFLEDVLFCETSREKMSFAIRSELFQKMRMIIKQHFSELSSEDQKKSRVLVKRFAQYLTHFKVLTSQFFITLVDRSKTDARMMFLVKSIDDSRTLSENMEDLLVTLFIESVQLCEQYLKSISPTKWKLIDVLTIAITKLTAKLRNKESDAMQLFLNLLSSLPHVENKETKGLLSEKATSMFFIFCLDKSLDVETRINILQELKKCSLLSTPQVSFLIFQEVKELIDEIWGSGSALKMLGRDSFQVEDITDDLVDKLVESLLLEENSFTQLKALVNILEKWTSIGGCVTWLEKHWKKALLLLLEHGPCGVDELLAITSRQGFSENMIEFFFKHLKSNSHWLAAMKLVLKTRTRSFYGQVGILMKGTAKIDEESLDDELLHLIISCDILPLTVGSLYFRHAFRHVFAEQSNYTQYERSRVFDGLHGAEHNVEAAALLLHTTGSHSTFATFGNSISIYSFSLAK